MCPLCRGAGGTPAAVEFGAGGFDPFLLVFLCPAGPNRKLTLYDSCPIGTMPTQPSLPIHYDGRSERKSRPWSARSSGGVCNHRISFYWLHTAHHFTGATCFAGNCVGNRGRRLR